jgi:hypothetical protein
MALGADWCNSARGFMFALGCIQSQSCHTDRCPTGVSTQDRSRHRALVVPDKAERVYNFHRATIESLAELVAAAGLEHPCQLAPAHFSRRVSPHEVKSFAELYPSLAPGELIAGTGDERFKIAWAMASAKEFRALPAAAAGSLPLAKRRWVKLGSLSHHAPTMLLAHLVTDNRTNSASAFCDAQTTLPHDVIW